MEPESRRVEPALLSATDLRGRVLETVSYSPGAGIELRATYGRRRGVLIDFGREVGGFPHLTFSAGKCRRVGMQAVESLGHLVKPLRVGALAGLEPLIRYSHFKAEAESQVDLPHCGGFRYLWIYPEHPGRVTLSRVWLEYTPYLTSDIDSCGYFLSSDDLLNRVWFSGLHTLEMCTIDPALGGVNAKQNIGEGRWVLVDGARRDRLIWSGDIGPAGAAVYTGNFNTGAVRDSLLSLGAAQEENGYIPACSPGPLLGRLASGLFGDYVAWWVICLYQYYLHTGDLETVRETFPVVKRALHFLHSQCRGGLYRQRPPNMFEWCYTVLRRGKPSYTNVLYYWALNSVSFLAHEAGEAEVSAGYISRAFRLGEVIRRSLWDEEKGVLVDTTADRRRVPQDANSLSIVSGLVGEPDESWRVLDYLRENMWEDWGSTNVDIPYYRLTPGFPPHNKRVFAFMNNYEALARFLTGDDSGAVELIKRCWGNMIDKEPGSTFWEWSGPAGEADGRLCSMCHAWSSGVVALLSKYVLGVRPVSPGYRRFIVGPRDVGLDWAEGRVMTPYGPVEVRIDRSKGGELDVKVKAPRKTSFEKLIPGASLRQR